MAISYDATRVTLVDHPLVQHKLSILRDVHTGTQQFRQLVRELAIFEGYEAMRDLPLEDCEVETPVAPATCKRLAGRKLAVVPILRAGLGMVDGLLEIAPAARVGHIGMERDEVTHEPHEYTARCRATSTSAPSSSWTRCSPPAARRSWRSTRCAPAA